MKVAVTALTLLVTVELVLGVPPPGYGPPQPFPPPQKYRPQNGGPIPAKFPPFSGSHFGKNEYYSKFNPHLLPPGVRLPQSKLPPTFGKYPPPPSPGKYQQFQQQQQHQQQQQQQHQPPPHHLPNFKPIGPQFQSKPQLLANLPNQHSPQGPHQFGGQDQQRLQPQPQPLPQITNIRTGPKLSVGPPDFPTRFPSIPTTATAAASHVVPATQPPPLEKRRGPYIINSDDERGPIKTIPAPNLNPADKPANFDEQLYRAQHQQSFVQQLDNSITDEKSSYQVTEDPSAYKPLSGQPSYFAPDPDTVQGPKIQSPPIDVADSIPSVGKVPLDVALQQHLDAQHQHQQVPAAAAAAESGDKLTAQELYALLNGNGVASAVVPQTAYMVPQQVMYAVPQPQPLDLQIGQPLQYSPQSVQLQYAQPLTAAAAATGVDLQYLQPQTVQYQPQPVHYQPQTVQYQPQAVQYQQYLQQQPGQYVSQQQTAEDTPSYEQEQQQQQDQLQQLQEQSQQQQQQQQQHQQQQQDQLQQQQQQQYTQQQQQQQQQYTQQQQQQQAVETSVQYQQEQELQDYEPRNNKATAAPEQQTLQQPDEESLQQDRGNFESIRNQYYSAVPNEQTAGVLAQIAESAAANRDAVAESSAAVVSATPAVDQPSYGKPSAEKSATGEQSAAVQMQTSVQIQQSVPLYEGSYASSRRHQEYADDGGVHDELMEGSESVAVSESAAVPSPSSVNGHAPSQFPYNAAKINAFAAN